MESSQTLLHVLKREQTNLMKKSQASLRKLWAGAAEPPPAVPPGAPPVPLPQPRFPTVGSHDPPRQASRPYSTCFLPWRHVSAGSRARSAMRGGRFLVSARSTADGREARVRRAPRWATYSAADDTFDTGRVGERGAKGRRKECAGGDGGVRRAELTPTTTSGRAAQTLGGMRFHAVSCAEASPESVSTGFPCECKTWLTPATWYPPPPFCHPNALNSEASWSSSRPGPWAGREGWRRHPDAA